MGDVCDPMQFFVQSQNIEHVSFFELQCSSRCCVLLGGLQCDMLFEHALCHYVYTYMWHKALYMG